MTTGLSLLASAADAAEVPDATHGIPGPQQVVVAGRRAEYLDILDIVATEAPLLPPRTRSSRRAGEHPMHIVYLVPITGPGGGARVLFEHANHLVALGDQVTVVSHFGRPDWMELRADFTEVPLGRRLAESIPADCDLVVAGFWDQVLAARRVAVAPVVHFEQGPHHLFEEIDVQQLVAVAHSVRAADATIAVGIGGAEALEDRYGVAARLVPNAVDITRFAPDGPAGPRHSVLFVGPDGSPFKGIDLARTIAARLAESHPHVDVVWVTPRPPVDGDFGRVVVGPSQGELATLYREALVYVCSSRFETWGLPALEAMASGTPVVSTAHGGIITFARDGENALLAPIGDADALLAATRRVLDNPVLAQRLSVAGLETARATTWPEVLHEVRSFYVETLASQAAGDSGTITGPEPIRLPDGVALVDPTDHVRLAARLETMPTRELAIPVSRPVRGAFRRVSWEVVARRDDAPEGTTRCYLPARSDVPPAAADLPRGLAGLGALAAGDHFGALGALLPALQTANAAFQPTVVRWVAVALIGLERHHDAFELASKAAKAYELQPDMYALSLIAATSAGIPIDHKSLMWVARLLGCGARFDEWFDDPFELMRAHLEGRLGL